MLMLEHKQVPYRRVDIVTLLHPLAVRLHGFDGGGQTRTAGRRRTLGLRLGDRLGTVPALAANGHRISTNHGIARFLDERHPQPPLFPADPEQRAAVEEAERWANETLQMAARRIPGAAGVRDPAAFSRSSGDGRLGYLLYKRALTRRLIAPRILRGVFASGPTAESELLAELPPALDRIDAWIADGILGGARAERRGLHGGAEPGVDPLSAGRHAHVRGPPSPRARGPAPARAGVGASAMSSPPTKAALSNSIGLPRSR